MWISPLVPLVPINFYDTSSTLYDVNETNNREGLTIDYWKVINLSDVFIDVGVVDLKVPTSHSLTVEAWHQWKSAILSCACQWREKLCAVGLRNAKPGNHLKVSVKVNLGVSLKFFCFCKSWIGGLWSIFSRKNACVTFLSVPHTVLECIHLWLRCNKVRLFSQLSEEAGASAADSVVLSLRPQNEKAILNTKKLKLYSNNSIY